MVFINESSAGVFGTIKKTVIVSIAVERIRSGIGKIHEGPSSCFDIIIQAIVIRIRQNRTGSTSLLLQIGKVVSILITISAVVALVAVGIEPKTDLPTIQKTIVVVVTAGIINVIENLDRIQRPPPGTFGIIISRGAHPEVSRSQSREHNIVARRLIYIRRRIRLREVTSSLNKGPSILIGLDGHLICDRHAFSQRVRPFLDPVAPHRPIHTIAMNIYDH